MRDKGWDAFLCEEFFENFQPKFSIDCLPYLAHLCFSNSSILIDQNTDNNKMKRGFAAVRRIASRFGSSWSSSRFFFSSTATTTPALLEGVRVLGILLSCSFSSFLSVILSCVSPRYVSYFSWTLLYYVAG
jgi:hypothetical protein